VIDISAAISSSDVMCSLRVLDTAHSMQSTIYVTVGCPSVSLSHRSAAATAAGGFAAAERRRLQHDAGGYRSIVTGTLRFLCSAANAGSVMLRADGGGLTQTC